MDKLPSDPDMHGTLRLTSAPLKKKMDRNMEPIQVEEIDKIDVGDHIIERRGRD